MGKSNEAKTQVDADAEAKAKAKADFDAEVQARVEAEVSAMRAEMEDELEARVADARDEPRPKPGRHLDAPPQQVWITKSAYLQQQGQVRPHYVEASPHNPVLVTLAAGVAPARNMKPVAQKPEKPKSGFEKKQSATTRPSHDEHPNFNVNKRAADQ